jgi:hypothetical protein
VNSGLDKLAMFGYLHPFIRTYFRNQGSFRDPRRMCLPGLAWLPSRASAMRPSFAILLLGLSILCSGCALVDDATRNVCLSLTTPVEMHREVARNRKWAEIAWAEVCRSSGPRGACEDYAQGFKDGYAEYLLRGGDGEPPLVAPQHYRHVRYQNPQGFQAIESWFAGYRHGAAVARDTGARRWITGPSALHGEPSGAVSQEAPPLIVEPTSVIKERPPLEDHGAMPAPMPRGAPGPTDERPAELPIKLEFGPVEAGTPSAIGPPVTIEPMEPEPVRFPIGMRAREVPQPLKIRITGVNEAPLLPDPPKARITNVSQAPAAPEPPRARITNIKTAPPVD